MALEKTILSPDLIAERLQCYYGLAVQAVQKLPMGSANCYLISAGGQNYFLKEFQNGFSGQDLNREARLAEYLLQHGIRTARIFPTVSGTVFFEQNGHIVCLEEYIEGLTFSYDNFPAKYLLETAAILGKLHQVMKNYSGLPLSMDEKWLSDFSVETGMEKYQQLSSMLETRKADPFYQQIQEDFLYKQKLLSRGKELAAWYQGITYVPSHGDYQGCQLICDEQHIQAVIDFSSAAVLPAIWEVMRSYIQSSASRETGRINIEELCQYVREYLKYYPLTKTDLESAPYVYLFQLMRSGYGYRQYLSGQSEDGERLLKFAFWRTKMCREVEQKAPEISARLSQLI